MEIGKPILDLLIPKAKNRLAAFRSKSWLYIYGTVSLEVSDSFFRASLEDEIAEGMQQTKFERNDLSRLARESVSIGGF